MTYEISNDWRPDRAGRGLVGALEAKVKDLQPGQSLFIPADGRSPSQASNLAGKHNRQYKWKVSCFTVEGGWRIYRPE